MKFLLIASVLLTNIAFARTFDYSCESNTLGKFKVVFDETTFKSSIEVEGKSYKEAKSSRYNGDLRVISQDASFKLFIDEQVTGIGTVSHQDTIGHVSCSRKINQ